MHVCVCVCVLAGEWWPRMSLRTASLPDARACLGVCEAYLCVCTHTSVCVVQQVPHELFVVDEGRHGMGLGLRWEGKLHPWTYRLKAWMAKR
jgi:hypothetical protein